MLLYDSMPLCGTWIAGIRGSDRVEKARKPSHPPAHVSRMARIRVGWETSIVYTRHRSRGAGTIAAVRLSFSRASAVTPKWFQGWTVTKSEASAPVGRTPASRKQRLFPSGTVHLT